MSEKPLRQKLVLRATGTGNASSSVLIGLLFFAALTGCEHAADESSDVSQMVYFDRATKKPVVYEVSTDIPAIDPRTGDATLVPASYCPECEKWFPSPPIEVRERNPKAALCPKGHSMDLDGPWPETELE